MRPRVKLMDIVHLEWIDSSSFHGWDALEVKAKAIDEDDMICVTAGFLVKRDSRAWSATCSLTHGGKSVHDTITIPVVAIRKVRLLSRAVKGKI